MTHSELNARNNVGRTDSQSEQIGFMDENTCSYERLNNQSECMQYISKSRLDYLRKKCLETLVIRGPQKSYLEGMPMIQIALAKLAAFLEEQKLILKMLNSLPKNCRPNNWFGYVVYQTVKTMETNRTIKNGSANITEEIQVRWMLRRLPVR